MHECGSQLMPSTVQRCNTQPCHRPQSEWAAVSLRCRSELLTERPPLSVQWSPASRTPEDTTRPSTSSNHTQERTQEVQPV